MSLREGNQVSAHKKKPGFHLIPLTPAKYTLQGPCKFYFKASHFAI